MYDGNDHIKGGILPNIEGLDNTPMCVIDNQTGKSMFMYGSQIHLLWVSVIYKRGNPIYAAYLGEDDGALGYINNPLTELWTRWNANNYSSNFFYRQHADFELDSATPISCTYFTFNPFSGNTDWGRGYFETDLTYTFTVSYQKYTAQTSDNPPDVWIEKDGDRVNATPSEPVNHWAVSLVSTRANYTDMNTGDFYDEIQNIYYEACVAVGYSVEPLVIKYPID